MYGRTHHDADSGVLIFLKISVINSVSNRYLDVNGTPGRFFVPIAKNLNMEKAVYQVLPLRDGISSCLLGFVIAYLLGLATVFVVHT